MSAANRDRSRRQLGRFGPFAALALLATLVGCIGAWMALDLQAAARAYLAGEAGWSLGQQRAVYQMHRYAETGDAEHREHALGALERLDAARQARLALQARPVAERQARDHLLASGIDAPDVQALLRFPRLLHAIPHVAAALETWRGMDPWIVRLRELAEELEAAWQAPETSQLRIGSIRDELSFIQETLADQAMRFNASLNQGARWMTETLQLIAIFVIVFIAILSMLVFRRITNRIARSQHRFWTTFEQAPVGMALVDADGSIDRANDALTRFLQRRRSELRGKPLAHFADARDRGALRKLIAGAERGDGLPQDLQARYVLPDGRTVWGKLSVADLGENPRGRHLRVAVLEDISEARNLSDELHYQAAHDQLTGLANRREFERHVNQLLHEPDLDTTSHALCMIDLDQFKVVNETFGHLAGDALLVRLSERMKTCLREGDVLARLDGDEFGVALPHCSLETAIDVAQRLRDVIREFRFTWEGRTLSVSASIGLVEVHEYTSDAHQLMQNVDLACHQAKDAGRNQVFVHSETQQASVKRQHDMDWVQRINEALDAQRLDFHAQLIAPSDPGDWRCELLLRLRDDADRLHTASRFMEAAERFHVARSIDRWVIERALQLVRIHRKRFPRVVSWHINLSGQSVDCEIMLPRIIRQIELEGVPPELLCFEITESAAIHSLEEAKRFFTALREIGCEVALDDFGKGLSTFDYLKQLPVDLVKIDGGFVRELAHSELDHAMVRSIQEIARIAGKQTIAESVESIELILRLKQIGIDFLQGHAIHNPQAVEDLEIPETPQRADSDQSA
ncbi:MAG: EAL domain-containing protein [Wenzhouxiangellaceae bacterium]|nr:EAL domain-containing protein [Wenzhouxiangellaceae bacterium]